MLTIFYALATVYSVALSEIPQGIMDSAIFAKDKALKSAESLAVFMKAQFIEPLRGTSHRAGRRFPRPIDKHGRSAVIRVEVVNFVARILRPWNP
jgi:hypothetical protein